MIDNASTYLRHLGIITQEDAKRVQVQQLNALRGVGQNVVVHEDADARIARIDFDRWLVDCRSTRADGKLCGACVIVSSEWSEAYCNACGAILTNVVYPSDQVQIEGAIEKRPDPRNRFWFPEKGETLETLEFQNMVIGVEPTPPELTKTVEQLRTQLKGRI